MIKVLIIGHSYLAKENRKQLDALSNYAEIQVASPSNFGGMIFDYNMTKSYINSENWKIKLYPKFKIPFLPESLYFFKSFDIGIKSFKPDIVHIEADPFSTVFLNAYFLTKIWAPRAKIISTIKQNTFTKRNFFIDTLKIKIGTFFSKFVDKFIAVNEGVKEIYINTFNVNEDRFISCTHIGVDIDLFTPANGQEKHEARKNFGFFENHIIIGYCGRLIEYKGVLDLLDAVKYLNIHSNHKFFLALLGNGPLYESLKLFSEENAWLKIIQPIPHAEVSNFMKGLDVFVMPSHILDWHEEHDSHAVIEAMSSGLPCIVSTSGSNKEVVYDAGIQIQPKEIKELANSIDELVSSTSKLKLYKSQARDRVINNYSFKSVSRIYYKAYKKVLNIK